MMHRFSPFVIGAIRGLGLALVGWLFLAATAWADNPFMAISAIRIPGYLLALPGLLFADLMVVIAVGPFSGYHQFPKAVYVVLVLLLQTAFCGISLHLIVKYYSKRLPGSGAGISNLQLSNMCLKKFIRNPWVIGAGIGIAINTVAWLLEFLSGGVGGECGPGSIPALIGYLYHLAVFWPHFVFGFLFPGDEIPGSYFYSALYWALIVGSISWARRRWRRTDQPSEPGSESD